MSQLERHALDSIKERTLDLQYVCQQFERFDPSEMLTEVHEMFETLIKLRSGKFYQEFESHGLDAEPEYSVKIVEVESKKKNKKRGRIVIE